MASASATLDTLVHGSLALCASAVLDPTAAALISWRKTFLSRLQPTSTLSVAAATNPRPVDISPGAGNLRVARWGIVWLSVTTRRFVPESIPVFVCGVSLTEHPISGVARSFVTKNQNRVRGRSIPFFHVKEPNLLCACCNSWRFLS